MVGFCEHSEEQLGLISPGGGLLAAQGRQYTMELASYKVQKSSMDIFIGSMEIKFHTFLTVVPGARFTLWQSLTIETNQLVPTRYKTGTLRDYLNIVMIERRI
jgi:hypothetical protein